MSSPKIKMSFECDQDWNSMSFANGGRHCGVCKKTVHDFTNYSHQQIQQIKKDSGELCGRFTAHQIDPSLIPLDELLPKKKIAFASILFFLGFGVNQSQSQEVEKPKQEIVDSLKTCSEKEKEKIEDEIDKKRILKKREQRREIIEEGWRVLSRGRTTYYMHWKYPFIVKHKRHVMGKFI